MNRIDKKFQELAGRKALITFVTVGDPSLEMSEKIVVEMQADGVDLIELGVPFSDPAADGPVIQQADMRALEQGIDIFKVFDFVKKIRDKVEVPLVFLLYYNVVLQYGVDDFFQMCAQSGIDGVIIPDLPYEESGEIAEATEKYGVYQILLVAPTSQERMKAIAQHAKGFLYCVSSLGVTGMKDSFDTNFSQFFSEIKQYTDVPCCVGFGISGKEQVKMLKQYADGVIVGSAIVDAIARGNTESEKLENLKEKVKELKEGLKE